MNMFLFPISINQAFPPFQVFLQQHLSTIYKKYKFHHQTLNYLLNMSEQIQDVLARMDEKFENKFQQQTISNPEILPEIPKVQQQNQQSIPNEQNDGNQQQMLQSQQPIQQLTLQKNPSEQQNQHVQQNVQEGFIIENKQQNIEQQENFILAPQQQAQDNILKQQTKIQQENLSENIQNQISKQDQQIHQQISSNQKEPNEQTNQKQDLPQFKQFNKQQQQQVMKIDQIIEQTNNQCQFIINSQNQQEQAQINILQQPIQQIQQQTKIKLQENQQLLPVPSDNIRSSQINIKATDSEYHSQHDVNEIQEHIDHLSPQFAPKDPQYSECQQINQYQAYEGEEEQVSQSISNNQSSQSQNYMHLSQKLQTALQKIQTSLTSKHLDQTQNSQMFARFEYYEKKKQRALEQRKKEVEAKTLFGVSYRPEINKKSKTMMIQQNYEPIYERYEKILSKKNQKIEQEQQKKKEKEEEQYQQFLEEFNSHCKVPDQVRSIDDFYQEMVNWKKKNQKTASEIAERKKKEQAQSATFKPIINKRSDKMASKNRIPIENRQVKPKIIKSQFTFTPKINKNRFGK